MYCNGIFTRKNMGVPVISVGNLTVGGTGKTPIVLYLAKLLKQNDFKPAVISRGYRGKSRHRINVVSDGKTILMDARYAGDEPLLLAESLPGIPIVTGAHRFYPCSFAVDNLGCDALILDDGFQHLSVTRDVDLVLFNAASPLGNNRVLPGGDMREPFSALARADAFMITGMREEYQFKIKQFYSHLRDTFPNTPIFTSQYKPLSCRKIGSALPISFSDLPNEVYGFCGIANPGRFLTTLKDCGFQITGLTEFKDHQTYHPNLISKIARLAEASGARALITTEKDIVKIHSWTSPLPLYALTMSAEADKSFSDFILKDLKNKFNI
jgi:tetraacyldisaccharide 4'-kinase